MDKPTFPNAAARWGVVVAVAVLGGLLMGGWRLHRDVSQGMLVAPMVGGLDDCAMHRADLVADPRPSVYKRRCLQSPDSLAGLVAATLAPLAPPGRADGPSSGMQGVGPFRLGYTLHVPLLKLFDLDGGIPRLNQDRVRQWVNTLRDVDRPVILYLFSDHFGVGSPVEEALLKDASNLLQTVRGPLARDAYYSVNIYPWSFARLDNPVTRLRETAVRAVLQEVCQLPRPAIERIEGVTMLGELHHLFPNFQAGMGFTGEYLITDYSEASKAGFRRYLQAAFGSVDRLNQAMGSRFAGFDAVQPPATDLRDAVPEDVSGHLDAFAHGILPVAGWVARSPGDEPPRIGLYVNGTRMATIPVQQGRQDVLAAFPAMGTADVGWSHDWSFAGLAAGAYRLDVVLETQSAQPVRLATRNITLLGRTGPAGRSLPMLPLPDLARADASRPFNVDAPVEGARYLYNPMARLWHQYRQTQVTRYLSHFAQIIRAHCIAPDRVYSHQILPFVNPGWDVNKFAVGDDLAVPRDVQLGVSLYGEASYGNSFFDWYRLGKRSGYGVTEFHPLKAMDRPELQAVLSRHAGNGARFVSFFLDSQGLEATPSGTQNPFSFDPRNRNAGSDVLYESARQILTSHR